MARYAAEQLALERVIGEDEVGQRFDRVAAQWLLPRTRTEVQRLIKSGEILVNQRPTTPAQRLKLGDVLSVATDGFDGSSGQDGLRATGNGSLSPALLDFSIIYEDDSILVCDKPAGITVHPGAGTRGTTLVEGVLYYLAQKKAGREDRAIDVLPGGEGRALRPGVVHRLDKDTSGLIVLAKTHQALADLSKQFQTKSAGRVYLALLDGKVPWSSHVRESYLGRDPQHRTRFRSVEVADFAKRHPERQSVGKGAGALRYAKSTFRRLAEYGSRLTLCEIELATGRTHQIRVHAKDLKAPVAADEVYGKPFELPERFGTLLRQRARAIKRQLLHAKELTLVHPTTGITMRFASPLPPDLEQILKLLEPIQTL